ncbi:Flagellar motor protein MotB [Candidatus Megaera venefica]|jgi:chemotaxis protein MotB|uniref:Flagellar motor protein MotB n=2 Tax=Candidatus Megaera venefica TaxID=2055910 RepID=A0ABU5NBV7_9RICK|nr:Flagellar motor protein MotB [Candidatus Megaera venefica]
MMAKQQQIIIKKIKKVQGGGHHGGAWKVAYADFVTAMMAFFLLLWLISVSDKATLQGVAQYFTPTESISDKAGLGFDGGADANIEKGTGAPNAASSSLIYGSPSKGHRVDSARMPSNMSDIERDHFISIMNSIQQSSELKSFADNIQIDITNEGLRIQIMDSDNRPMFKPNTADLQPYMEKIITIIAKMVSTQPNYISISGHTASVKAGSDTGIDFWNISADRANEVRKFMTQKLIDKGQVVKIIGLSDREPFDPKDPFGIKNIRVGITLLNEASITAYQKSVPTKIGS